ncbi:MAG: flagellin [Sterolibacterium sp.]|nr:flagellin [Sterolibacterium sp.]
MTLSISLNTLNTANTALAESLARLSSAKRINSAKDDAAGLAIAEAMGAQLGSGNQAIRNVYDGLSLTSTAEGALGQVTESLQRMRELAVQAANGTNSAADRQALQNEFNQIGQGLEQLANTTQFNGQKLLDGSYNGQIQAGPNPGDTRLLTIGNGTPQALGVVALDVTSSATAATAIDALDSALGKVNSMRAEIGAAQAGLGSTLANLSGTYENLAAAKSRISDADYARETGNLSRNAIQQQAATQALALYNANQSSVLSLINPTKG